MNFTFKPFNSWQDINSYVGSNDYGRDSNNSELCFAFAIVENSASDYDIKLMFNDREEQSKDQMIPS